MVPGTKGLFLCSCCHTSRARVSWLQRPSVYSVAGRWPGGQPGPCRQLSLTHRQKDFCGLAQGFCFYFIVNLNPKERKLSFSDMARSEEMQLKENIIGG